MVDELPKVTGGVDRDEDEGRYVFTELLVIDSCIIPGDISVLLEFAQSLTGGGKRQADGHREVIPARSAVSLEDIEYLHVDFVERHGSWKIGDCVCSVRMARYKSVNDKRW